MSIIQLHHVSKCFTLEPERPRSFQELVLGFLLRRPRHRPKELLWALQDISFEVQAGEMIGIIGSNGSGKSTCLKLLTRIFEPTSGRIQVDGRVSALLELGVGFHPELTGRENIYLHGSMLGLPRRELARQIDDIVAFAEMERFVDIPVKFYSSGMYVRLAFAAAINVHPDVLLIDEVLAVGDQHFQHKCIQRIEEMRSQGVTIVFVSHDLATVERLCDRVLWFDEGRLHDEGEPKAVIPHYLAAVDPDAAATWAGTTPHETQPAEPVCNHMEQTLALSACIDDNPPPCKAPIEENPLSESLPAGCQPRRWGSRRAEITDVRFLDKDGHPLTKLTADQPVTIAFQYRAFEPIQEPAFGVAIHRVDGLHISGCNTAMANYHIPHIVGTGEVRFHIERLPLLEGEYLLSVAVHKADDSECYDYLSHWYPFRVVRGQAIPYVGVMRLAASWEHLPTSSEKRP
ncbi:MAG: ABC transporter ATP-binding protein [Chloroflexi bacterium]|nr:ABC transporter ATP-binding protein [Chloroflexota bacterium]